MLVLMGPEEYSDRDRNGMPEKVLDNIGKTGNETDAVTRRLLLESLLGLCATRYATIGTNVHSLLHVRYLNCV